MSITTIDWQGFSGLQLENEALSVVALPELGGKIVSIFDKRVGYEWLVGPKRPLRRAAVGDDFAAYDLSGWDEMFPTIDACRYTDANGRTFDLPDHGELWALPWTQSGGNDGSLSLSTSGIFQPYTLERQIMLDGAASLRFDYRLTSHADEPFAFIWAAHPLFRAYPDTILTFDPAHPHMIQVSAQPPLRDEQPDRAVPFPSATLVNGDPVDLSRVGQATLPDSRKFYVPPNQQTRAVRFEQPSAGATLDFSWSGAAVRYLGLWIDERSHSVDYVLAPEPCTGYYDALTIATANGHAATIAPDETITWSLRLACSVKAHTADSR